MKEEIKKSIVYALANTCVILILLIIVSIVIDRNPIHEILGAAINVNHFFQILGASIIIQFGLFFTRKFDGKYVILEYLLDMSFIVIVVFIFSAIFGWFTDRFWILMIMVIIFYIFGLITNTIRTRKDAKEMNELLQKRRKKLMKV